MASGSRHEKLAEVDRSLVTEASTRNSRTGFDTGRLQAKLCHHLAGLERDQGKWASGIAVHGKETISSRERKLNGDLNEFVEHSASLVECDKVEAELTEVKGRRCRKVSGGESLNGAE